MQPYDWCDPRCPNPCYCQGIIEATPRCSPLCGASKAYGRFDKPWKHEPQCPVRVEWESERRAEAARYLVVRRPPWE